MPMLPISAFVTLLLAYLALRSAVSKSRPLLVLLLVGCSVQSLLVTLVIGYGMEVLRPILPVSAAIIPPLAWVTCQDALVCRLPARRAALHLAAPGFTLFCRVFASQTVDVIVPAIFVGYGGAILWQLRQLSDIPLARIEAGEVPRIIWQALGGALIISALSDVAISLAIAWGKPDWVGWLISFSSSLALLLLGFLSRSPAATGSEDSTTESQPVLPLELLREDAEIFTQLEKYLLHEPVHLDPNLNLTRLARRLHLPEKRLSSAVNRSTGGNVSRYVNSWRVRHACMMIEKGASVTDAMLESGFNTKSNFNREFMRVTRRTPTQWKRSLQGPQDPQVPDDS